MLLIQPSPLTSLFQKTTTVPSSSSPAPRSSTTRDSTNSFSHSKTTPPFDETPNRETTDYAALIHHHARRGRPDESISLFRELVVTNRHKPNDLSITTSLGCCASLGAVRSGQEIHAFMLRHTQLGACSCSNETSLVRFYAKCGLLLRAREVFDRMLERDVVSWTVMLMAYADGGDHGKEMVSLFVDMMSNSVAPNSYTFTVLLRAAGLELGEQLHAYVLKKSWGSDAFIGSSLVDLYAKNGNLDAAKLVFCRIEHKDVVCYNSLISGYAQVDSAEFVIYLFGEMSVNGVEPSQSTFVALLNGCATSGFSGLSKQLHAQIVIRGFGSDEVIQGVVIDMYAKCGDLGAAHIAFLRIAATKNVAIWNSMIGGYGKHGLTKEALHLFVMMESAMVRPDHITFICILSACSHSGLIEEGWRLFQLMIGVYGITARNEHYCCMVDLLGRAGMVREAYYLICRFKCDYKPSVWGALLSACRHCGDAEIGEIAAKKLFELEPDCSGSYVAMASIYAGKGRWGDAVALRELMDDQKIRKDAGCSWIEIGGVVRKFRAGEQVGNDVNLVEVHSMCSRLNACISDQLQLEDWSYYLEEQIE
ncbi:putative pentatricopeptide repeat-containing protein At3g13770, mitochondrial [Typha latifolia]|uniref:putative pentatricopeptide repeat-containing protein At3g13770, mitochondrial n=1 Tax=Typha latifolia TaxID=4733 RepID=UPI003C2B7BBF